MVASLVAVAGIGLLKVTQGMMTPAYLRPVCADSFKLVRWRVVSDSVADAERMWMMAACLGGLATIVGVTWLERARMRIRVPKHAQHIECKPFRFAGMRRFSGE